MTRRGPPPVVVLDVVGLTPAMLGADTPALTALATDGFAAPLAPTFPAVTLSAQSTMLTGTPPRAHGVVGNGWYDRALAEVMFWKQSSALVAGPRLWDTARRARPDLRVTTLFWWFNMYASVDRSVTLRPIYPADGRKIPALYGEPAELPRALERALGPFPMFEFWGPAAGLGSSRWIAEAAAWELEHARPDLLLVYLPHLDYDLQRFGPGSPRARVAIRAIDRVAGRLIDRARAAGAEIVVVSEYGLEAATLVVHPNRVLRDAGLVRVRETLGWELLDPGASRAFAVADHQVAHVYVRDPHDRPRVAALLAAVPGIERVLDDAGKAALGLDHPRAGDLVLVAEPGCWFSYYYWLDDARAPDFARTVDIHRKPGYDPVELFLDPDRRLIKARVAWNLLKKKLGFRMLMDVVPLRADLVRGTHGRISGDASAGPLVIASSRRGARERLAMAEVHDLLLARLAG